MISEEAIMKFFFSVNIYNWQNLLDHNGLAFYLATLFESDHVRIIKYLNVFNIW